MWAQGQETPALGRKPTQFLPGWKHGFSVAFGFRCAQAAQWSVPRTAVFLGAQHFSDCISHPESPGFLMERTVDGDWG